ncbi:phosphoglucosamine mutase [Candidatus Endowatersipora endosymbiont of Watersipora subatra]|uniref:phosphoglucosamine mutase n=1 Tax=Candidatus Endowatersipora endosymbiont of Watersipora subatra TaxID=3077946 RepID=UPI00312CAECB
MVNKIHKYFGTDGIRGYVNRSPMTAETAMKIGMAVGLLFRCGSHRHRVVLGKDTRLSGYMLENAVVSGFTASGMDVYLLGSVPTPAVAMLTRSLRADIGVMISASHNAYHDNGIKLFGPEGTKFSDETEEKIEALIDQDLTRKMADSARIGRAKRIEGIYDRYIEFAKRTVPRNLSLDGLRVVIDCANGAAYKVAPAILWELGVDVISIGVEPNGMNINAKCGSTHTKQLEKKVRETHADIGIALDGDADRVIIVDEKSNIIDGDQLIAVVSQFWKEKGLLSGDGVVGTIMSNLGLERFLSSMGLSLTRTPVGDRYIVECMRKNDFNIGGEQSGHIVLSDYAPTSDGLVAALQLLAIVKSWDKSVSEICGRFEPVPQILKNVHYSRKDDFLKDEQVIEVISDARNRLENKGRLVVRRSGTEPVIRVMAEGDDKEIIETVVNDICNSLTKKCF